MEIRNAKHIRDGRIDCEINHPVFGWIPTTADENDSDETCRLIFAAAKTIAEPYVETAEELARLAAIAERNARAIRDGLLAACDWTQLPDAPVDQTAWAAYRQALRDVPEQTGWPSAIVWPVKPE